MNRLKQEAEGGDAAAAGDGNAWRERVVKKAEAPFILTGTPALQWRALQAAERWQEKIEAKIQAMDAERRTFQMSNEKEQGSADDALELTLRWPSGLADGCAPETDGWPSAAAARDCGFCE